MKSWNYWIRKILIVITITSSASLNSKLAMTNSVTTIPNAQVIKEKIPLGNIANIKDNTIVAALKAELNKSTILLYQNIAKSFNFIAIKIDLNQAQVFAYSKDLMAINKHSRIEFTVTYTVIDLQLTDLNLNVDLRILNSELNMSSSWEDQCQVILNKLQEQNPKISNNIFNQLTINPNSYYYDYSKRKVNFFPVEKFLYHVDLTWSNESKIDINHNKKPLQIQYFIEQANLRNIFRSDTVDICVLKKIIINKDSNALFKILQEKYNIDPVNLILYKWTPTSVLLRACQWDKLNYRHVIYQPFIYISIKFTTFKEKFIMLKNKDKDNSEVKNLVRDCLFQSSDNDQLSRLILMSKDDYEVFFSKFLDKSIKLWTHDIHIKSR